SNKAANPKLAPGGAHEDFSINRQRRHGGVVAVLVFFNLCGPDFLACLRLNGDKHRLAGSEEHFVRVTRQAARRCMRHNCAFSKRSSETPEELTRLRLESNDLIYRCRNKHYDIVNRKTTVYASYTTCYV